LRHLPCSVVSKRQQLKQESLLSTWGQCKLSTLMLHQCAQHSNWQECRTSLLNHCIICKQRRPALLIQGHASDFATHRSPDAFPDQLACIPRSSKKPSYTPHSDADAPPSQFSQAHGSYTPCCSIPKGMDGTLPRQLMASGGLVG